MLTPRLSRSRFRSSTRRANVDRRRSFESLESRQVMAGNITAGVDATGNLNVYSDDSINGIYVTQVGQGKFLIAGLEAGGSATTVNGSAQSITLSGVTGSITVHTGDGDDLVQLDYFNHIGNLTVDASYGHDMINIGSDNKASYLSGNLVLGYGNSYVVNMLKINVVGTLISRFSGLVVNPLGTVTTNSTEDLFRSLAAENPDANSYAITSCTFSSDVTLGGFGALQVFIESSRSNGTLRIDNGTNGYSWIPPLTAKPSFVVLNNVSTKGGLDVRLFSSTSFVMNNCTIGEPAQPGVSVATAKINILGARNIYQLSNSVFHANLQITNNYFNLNGPIFYNPINNPITFPNAIVPIGFDTATTPSLTSVYDVIQLNNLTCKADASIASNGNISVKNSVFETLNLNAKNFVKLDHVTAADATIYLSSSIRRTSASVLNSTFDNLSIGADVQSRFDYNVSIIDSTVHKILDINGRGSLPNPISQSVVDAQPVFSSANANILIDRSQIGTMYYSYRVDNVTPPFLPLRTITPVGTVIIDHPLPTIDIPPRTEAEIYQGIYGGTGKDTLTIKNSTFDKVFAQLGAGDDSISFEKSKILTTGHVDGSLGTDTLTRDNDASVSKAGFINFESTLPVPTGVALGLDGLPVINVGTLNISGSSLAMGRTVIGTVEIGGSKTGGNVTITGTNSAGGLIDFNAPGATGGTLTIPGTNSFSGGTVVLSSGVININRSGSIAGNVSTAILSAGSALGNGTGVIRISTTSEGPMNGMSNEEALAYMKSQYTLTVGQKVVINSQEFTIE